MGHIGARRLDRHGQDQHATIQTTLEDAYGRYRTVELRVPVRTRRWQRPRSNPHWVVIPKASAPGGISAWPARACQAAGGAGTAWTYRSATCAGYTVDRQPQTSMDLPITPWEAALGAEVEPHPPAGSKSTYPQAPAAGQVTVKGVVCRHGTGKLPGDFTSRCASTAAGNDDCSRLSAAAAAFPSSAQIAANHQSGFADTRRHTRGTA
jgi:curved DNA-binding protein